MKFFFCLFASAVVILLEGCTSAYVPYEGKDAAKVQLKLVNWGGIFDNAYGNYRPLDEAGQCGTATRLITPPTPAPAGLGNRKEWNLQLAPGRYMFSFLGGSSLGSCGVDAILDFAADRQYSLEFQFDPAIKKCHVFAQRFDNVAWSAYPMLPGQACKN